ncbi:hypothetical protein ACFLY9_00440 [Patescibacteria group bacterium]
MLEPQELTYDIYNSIVQTPERHPVLGIPVHNCSFFREVDFNSFGISVVTRPKTHLFMKNAPYCPGCERNWELLSYFQDIEMRKKIAFEFIRVFTPQRASDFDIPITDFAPQSLGYKLVLYKLKGDYYTGMLIEQIDNRIVARVVTPMAVAIVGNDMLFDLKRYTRKGYLLDGVAFVGRDMVFTQDDAQRLLYFKEQVEVSLAKKS